MTPGSNAKPKGKAVLAAFFVYANYQSTNQKKAQKDRQENQGYGLEAVV